MSVAVDFQNVSIVFGDKPEIALPLMDAGKSRGEIQAETGQILGVHDCSITVGEGEILVLMGLSGSGKSTLLRLIAGLEQPDEGAIRLGERELVGPGGSLSPEQRGVGMVFQALELWPHLTVAEHIAFGLPGRPRGRKARNHPDVIRLAKDVGLDEAMLGSVREAIA